MASAEPKSWVARRRGARVMSRRLAGTLFVMLGLMLWARAAAATPAGTVVGTRGSCSTHGRVLKPGDAVQVGDNVNVPANGNLQLRMSDGSVISVAPGSSMAVASYDVGGSGRRVKLSLTQGVLRANVAPTRGPSTFEVSTPVGSALVRSDSADLFIDVHGGSSQVGVLEGTVDLASAATGQSVSIPGHWGTRLEAGRAPVLPRRWGQLEFGAVIRLTECCQPSQQ